MSREAVESIIGKTVVDSQFREALFADPDQVLRRYDLTREEVAGLKTIDSETMDFLAGTLDQRISNYTGISNYFLADSSVQLTWAGLTPEFRPVRLG